MTSTLPTITIVIPAKNESKFIAECLAAIRNLDYPRQLLEICVVDNGSTDDTLAIAESSPGVKVFSMTGNIGAVRNYGAQAFTGELIAFLDADCIPESDWLTRSVAQLRENDLAVISGILRLESQDCPWIEKAWVGYLRSRHASGLNYVKTIYSFCFVVPRKVMEEVGWFNEGLATCEDSDLGYRIHQLGYRLAVDPGIEIIHMRNAKTAKQFFKRQLWHGGSNLKNLFFHKFELAEMPSIAIPAFYLLAIFSLPFLFFLIGPISFLVVLTLVVGLPITIALRKGRRGYTGSLMSFAYLWFLYLTARGFGLLLKFGSPWK